MPSADTYFSPANARMMSAKAAEARRIAAEKRELAEIERRKIPDLLPEELFRLQTLARVRKQMQIVFDMMEDEEDAGKIDRLASALSRLNEQERQLSNRSLPPSQKPIAPGRASRPASLEPTPAEPSPAHSPSSADEPNG